jgi:translation initiation factor 3 subunit E
METKAHDRYELVKETNMVDYVETLYNGAKDAGASVESIGKSLLRQSVGAALMVDFSSLKNKATEQYETLQEKARPVMKVIDDPEAVEKLKSSGDKEKNLEILRSEYNVCRLWNSMVAVC